MTARPARKKAKAAAKMPGEVRAFAEELGILDVVEASPHRIGEFFAGVDVKGCSFILEEDPEVSGWCYVVLKVQVDGSVEEVLDAEDRMCEWLAETLPPDKGEYFVVVGDFVR